MTIKSLGNAVIRVMRRFGTFLMISSALAVRAAAGPMDDRAQVEALSRTAQEHGLADVSPSGAGPVFSPNETPRAGNPLSAFPLSALSATRDRPLFSALRRPPVVPAPMPEKQEAPAPPPPEQPSFTLIGTIVGKEVSVAVLQGSSADAISRLLVGGEDNGWRVRGIDLRAIVVEKGAQSIKLDLPRPDRAPPDLPRPDGAPAK
jgi:hypothetical protein